MRSDICSILLAEGLGLKRAFDCILSIMLSEPGI